MLARIVLALAALAVVPAFAQAPAAAAASAATVTDDALYRALGGQPGLVALVDDFVPRLVADPRIGHFFAKTDLPNFKEMLVQQLCQVSGGGCAYHGASMKLAHEELDIRKADFNALVVQLQEAMAARGVPFATQNQLLARLAPMHRDIVEPR